MRLVKLGRAHQPLFIAAFCHPSSSGQGPAAAPTRVLLPLVCGERPYYCCQHPHLRMCAVEWHALRSRVFHMCVWLCVHPAV